MYLGDIPLGRAVLPPLRLPCTKTLPVPHPRPRLGFHHCGYRTRINSPSWLLCPHHPHGRGLEEDLGAGRLHYFAALLSLKIPKLLEKPPGLGPGWALPG